MFYNQTQRSDQRAVVWRGQNSDRSGFSLPRRQRESTQTSSQRILSSHRRSTWRRFVCALKMINLKRLRFWIELVEHRRFKMYFNIWTFGNFKSYSMSLETLVLLHLFLCWTVKKKIIQHPPYLLVSVFSWFFQVNKVH